MMLRKCLIFILLIAYGALFYFQELQFKHSTPKLNFPLPIAVQKTVLGFLRQIGGEAHFIKASVILGGLDPSKPEDAPAKILSAHFKSMAALHPHFIDTYYLCESGLAHLGPQETRQANAVMTLGMKALPENWFLPFFKGFNHFYYLGENRIAADELLKASKLPNGPPWLAHLASMLAAEGGDILAGLTWLKTMLQTETEPAVRRRYQREVLAFEQAFEVQKAVNRYREMHGVVPETLEALIPDFISALPDFKDKFSLSWEPPNLHMQRTNIDRLHMSNPR